MQIVVAERCQPDRQGVVVDRHRHRKGVLRTLILGDDVVDCELHVVQVVEREVLPDGDATQDHVQQRQVGTLSRDA